MNENYIPDWKLEGYLLGKLPPEELDLIYRLELGNAEIRGRLDALRASDAEILAKYPPERMLRQIREAWRASMAAPEGKLSGSRRARSVPLWAVPVFVCAALLLVLPLRIVLSPPPAVTDTEAVAASTRAKGEAAPEALTVPAPSIEVWRKAGSGIEQLAPETAVSAGDVVQVRYTVPESCYGALVSVDGRGVLTVHLSGENGMAVPLTPGRPVTLNTSYELDDAPAFEAFYLITADGSFDFDSVKPALQSASHPINGKQSLLLPKKLITAFTLRKIPDGGGANKSYCSSGVGNMNAVLAEQ